MATDLSWKNNNFIFTPKTTSASMLTCRRRVADTPQTLPQTLPLTLISLGARKRVFSGRNGITTILLEKAEILPLFCIFRNWYFYR